MARERAFWTKYTTRGKVHQSWRKLSFLACPATQLFIPSANINLLKSSEKDEHKSNYYRQMENCDCDEAEKDGL